VTERARRRCRLAVVGLLVLGLVGCSSGDDDTAGEETTPPISPTQTSDAAGEAPAPSTTVPESAPLVGTPLAQDLPTLAVFAPTEGGAGEAPEFRWEAVEGAVRYSLAVRGPDGPLWGWQGEETQIYFGGLPFERPPGWAGPVLLAGSCWSVVARDTDGHVIAASAILPVSPADSTGHTCGPGEGTEP
jgi:hypothetical protein